MKLFEFRLPLLACAGAVAVAACSDASTPAPPAEGPAGSAGADLGGEAGRAGSSTLAGTGGTTGGAAGANTGGADAGEVGSGGDPAAGGAPERPVFPLKVLTLNNPNFALELAAADVQASGADVVGLQEVTPTDAADLCALLGPEWTFVQEDRVNTFAIVSRLPILRRIGVTEETRGGIGATIEVAPGLRAHVFDTHGMYDPYGPYQLGIDGMALDDVLASEEAVRMPGLRELIELSAPYVAVDDAVFLVGDFNAPSHLDYDPPVPWPTSVAPTEAGFVDSYATLHPTNQKRAACEFAIDDPGITWTQLPEAEPNGCYDRIDFVYFSAGDAEPTDAHTIDVASSDHRAVLTTFEITGPERDAKPSRELPRDTAAINGRRALLTWTPALDAGSEEVFLDSADATSSIGSSELGQLWSPLLAPNTTYSWRVGDGDTWTFTAGAGGGLTPDKASYAPGETISVAFDGGDSALDWIGLYARRAAHGPGTTASVWSYLNGDTAAPASVIADGSVSLLAPTEPGSYALRFFHDDGYQLEDELFITVE